MPNRSLKSVRFPSHWRQLLRVATEPLLLMMDIEGVLATPTRDGGNLWWHPYAQRGIQRLILQNHHQLYLITRRKRAEVLDGLNIPYTHVISPHALERSDQLIHWLSQTRELLTRLPQLPGWTVQDHCYSISFHNVDYTRGGLETIAQLQLPSGWQLVVEPRSVTLQPTALNVLNKVTRLIQRHPEHRPVFLSAHTDCEATFVEVQKNGGVPLQVGHSPRGTSSVLFHRNEVAQLLHSWTMDFDPLPLDGVIPSSIHSGNGTLPGAASILLSRGK